MAGSGQDKGLGPKWAKLLSAHRFLWARGLLGWASDSAITPIGVQVLAGPRPCVSRNVPLCPSVCPS
jgi:hypothetical protein